MNFLINAIWWIYVGILIILSFYGIHRYWILYRYFKYYKWGSSPVNPPPFPEEPLVTVQLPLYNEASVAERLIRAGARVGAKDKLGTTPVLMAASCGKDRVIEILHAAGASVTVKNRRGWTPLAIAIKKGHASTVVLLRRLGATD